MFSKTRERMRLYLYDRVVFDGYNTDPAPSALEYTRVEWPERKSANNDWWRCDGCGHAVAWKSGNEIQTQCPNCGAQLPARYDKQ